MIEFIKKINLKNRQKAIDKKYIKEGLTDEVLEMQITLNQERHESDISDSTKKVHENYVQ